jgi:hypothetical protein
MTGALDTKSKRGAISRDKSLTILSTFSPSKKNRRASESCGLPEGVEDAVDHPSHSPGFRWRDG